MSGPVCVGSQQRGATTGQPSTGQLSALASSIERTIAIFVDRHRCGRCEPHQGSAVPAEARASAMDLANKVAAMAKRTLPVSGVFDEVGQLQELITALQGARRLCRALVTMHAARALLDRAYWVCIARCYAGSPAASRQRTPLSLAFQGALLLHTPAPGPAAHTCHRRVQEQKRGGRDCGQAGGTEQAEDPGGSA
jgi:hypothetical protein